ncbi:MAG TPA: two-component regulator propeller domain-containing protein [Verrucomicrobiae bacterium]|jgi:ligand-binding sensor domain-containing protein/two-component sensor histidine kinase|nr:two-component regulator propeller domain-containing protein [Verrucomicrobiae bacterium]
MQPSNADGRIMRCGLWALVLALLLGGGSIQGAVLWSDLGATLAYETGDGSDILSGAVKRDDSSTDTLYFKFHVDPLSDVSTEEYFAAFELYEGGEERLGVGNALKAWAYSAFKMVVSGDSIISDYVDLHSSRPQSTGGTNATGYLPYEHPYRGLESTIVVKVQYVAGGDDLITIWLNPDLGPGASEASQPENLITRMNADASFDEIRLRHGGGGGGWIFSDMEIADSFADFVSHDNSSGSADAGFAGNIPLTFQSWQREQGLPQNFVRAVAQTRDGYLWVGSDDGVGRFDGLRFVPFGLREGLNSGPVRTLLGDRRGALWIGGAANGLTRFQNGRFVTVSNLPSDAILALAEDKAGGIWIGTENGLALWRDGALASVPPGSEFRGHAVAALASDEHGALWAGVKGAGVFRIDGSKLAKVSDPSVRLLLEDPHCLLADREGRLWVGAADEFVLYLEKDRWHAHRIHPHQGKPYISSLAETPDGTVWAASVGEGLFQFKGGAVQAMNALSGLSDNLAEALFVDQQGALWVGTHGGLNRMRAQTVISFGQREGLGYGAVQGLAEVAPGVVWAGKLSDGLYRRDGRSFHRLSSAGLSLAGPQVNALLRARDGSCWVAAEHGLLHFKNPLSISSQVDLVQFTNGANVVALAEDREGGLWAGTRGGELWRLRGEQWTAQTQGWQSRAITAIVQDRDGSMLIGTQGAGLFRLRDGATDRVGKKEGLLSDLIRTLYLDPDGSLWIGTEGGGLSRLHDGKISTFTTRDRLPDNTISQIVEDDSGRLWLGSNRGIACVGKRELEDLEAGKTSALYPQVYGRDEGMPSEECTSGFFPAGLKTASGRLWFSTLKGIVMTDPQPRLASASALSVALEDALVDGVPTPKLSAEGGSTLHLPPGKHRLEFGYTAVCFDAPDRVRFRYRLEPLDPDWFDAGTRRTASYPFVPPGDYRFVVSAGASEGVWGPPTTMLTLTVARHFWQAWWFIGLAVAAVLGAVAAIARLVEKRKLQQRLRQLEQEKVLEHERTRIAQDLHDEMGAKLCRISFLSEHARRGPELPGELRSQIISISDASREVLHSLDEIVWAVNPRNDSLEPVASYIGQYAQEYFQETGIQCELDIPAQFPFFPLSSQLRHHLFHAVHEALTNTLKHSRATRAKISIKCETASFEISISDDGAGFDATRTDGAAFVSGNGLRNMRERLAGVGGCCYIESQPGRGATVRFVIPRKAPVRRLLA